MAKEENKKENSELVHFYSHFHGGNMKNEKTKKRGLLEGSKIAIAATMMSVPMLTMPVTGFAQKGITADPVARTSGAKSGMHFIKISNASACKIVGLENGKPVYQNDKGQYFQLDSKTGDMKFISSDIFIKWQGESSSASSRSLNFQKIKMDYKVSLLGIDENGNTIHQNSKGEKFYLDPKTGDMKFVK